MAIWMPPSTNTSSLPIIIKLPTSFSMVGSGGNFKNSKGRWKCIFRHHFCVRIEFWGKWVIRRMGACIYGYIKRDMNACALYVCIRVHGKGIDKRENEDCEWWGFVLLIHHCPKKGHVEVWGCVNQYSSARVLLWSIYKRVCARKGVEVVVVVDKMIE